MSLKDADAAFDGLVAVARQQQPGGRGVGDADPVARQDQRGRRLGDGGLGRLERRPQLRREALVEAAEVVKGVVSVLPDGRVGVAELADEGVRVRPGRRGGAAEEERGERDRDSTTGRHAGMIARGRARSTRKVKSRGGCRGF
ncbi:MAG: hypothetical protein QM754_18955 [Tepidisphaeraceae bacterium]